MELPPPSAFAPPPLYAINQTRQVFLATDVRKADGFFRRLCGLLATPAREFGFGHGLWIQPSRGVHMLGMRYPIDAVYVDEHNRVVHIEPQLQPWRLGAICKAAVSVLELPAGAVAATETQVGDEICFWCAAG
ncbi:MAG: DUF192 domain-containing protein [Acidobacteria bacterium]|nr:MAG: DUF192 domain-containing protein [Acidobacteriota bacterium]